MNLSEETIIKELRTIFDPEIPVNIYDIGLIYKIEIINGDSVRVLMTLTSPNCPVADSLIQEVDQKIRALDGVEKLSVELTFEPPWSEDLLTEEAKLELGLL
jgi:FeS assembly SUF system protein